MGGNVFADLDEHPRPSPNAKLWFLDTESTYLGEISGSYVVESKTGEYSVDISELSLSSGLWGA